MKIKVIACEALSREYYFAAAKSPHVIDFTFLAFGLHNTPDDLRAEIQRQIDSVDPDAFDYIILGYGLCSRGSADVKAGLVPMVITRAHDCITMFLGSRERYDREFAQNPGTYWYSPGWIERKEGEADQSGFGDVQAKAYQEKYKEYVDKYGEDNAAFLMEQESQWIENYTRAAFINTNLGDIEEYRKFTKELAIDRGWEYMEVDGDLSLIDRLMNGQWDNKDFLVIQPGRTIIESFDELVLKSD